MFRVLDRYDSASARTVLRLQPQQPEAQRRRPPQRRPGSLLGRRQRPQRLVAGEQRAQMVVVRAPVVGGDRQVEQQAVLAGEIEIEHARERPVRQPEDVVAKEVGMDDAARQAGVIAGGLEIELGEQSTALVGGKLRRQRAPGRFAPGGAAGIRQRRREIGPGLVQACQHAAERLAMAGVGASTQAPARQVNSAAGLPARGRHRRPCPSGCGRGQGMPRAARCSCRAR